MGEWQQDVFRAVDRVASRDLRQKLGRSRVLRPLRDRMLRADSGRPRLARGEISFEGLTFEWAADYRTFEHAKRQGIEARTSRLIMQQARPGDLCVDVGGNFGFLTHIMALTVGAEGRVVSFEIDPWTSDVMRSSLQTNQLENVELFGAAGDGTGGTTTVDKAVANVDDGRRVAFLKVDVDGPDFDVLVGSEKTVERWRPFLSVEMAPGRERDIYEWVAARYPHVADVDGLPVTGTDLPVSLFAATEPIVIPPRMV